MKWNVLLLFIVVALITGFLNGYMAATSQIKYKISQGHLNISTNVAATTNIVVSFD